MAKKRSNKNKVTLVFDENKRREFLTGFHKRKVQRKKEWKDKFERDLKNERKRIKIDAKESYKKLIVSHRPVPELEHLIKEEYDEEDVTVKVIELSTDNTTRLGVNQPLMANASEESEESEEEKYGEPEVPGMELKHKLVPKVKTEKVAPSTKKDIRKLVKKAATKNVKKSKIFQMKNKMERQKQKKKSLHLKKEKIKFHNKRNKKKNIQQN